MMGCHNVHPLGHLVVEWMLSMNTHWHRSKHENYPSVSDGTEYKVVSL
jgi:hypothetical protein